MLLLNLILRACILLAGETCPLYAFTTISMGGRKKILAASSMGEHGNKFTVWEVEGKQIHT